MTDNTDPTAEWIANGWACKQCGDLEMLEATDEDTIVNGPFVEGLCVHCREDGHGAHDYATKNVLATAINGTHVLVGECGGLSAVFSAEPSAAMPGCIAISTEHGYLYVDNDRELEVLNEQ
mgnify:CR=1 FL=1